MISWIFYQKIHHDDEQFTGVCRIFRLSPVLFFQCKWFGDHLDCACWYWAVAKGHCVTNKVVGDKSACGFALIPLCGEAVLFGVSLS